MKYAREVIGLMAAHPGRDWRMVEIVRYVDDSKENRHRVRIGVLRVLKELETCGSVLIRPPRTIRGGYALYRWRET